MQNPAKVTNSEIIQLLVRTADHAHFIVEALESIKGLYLRGERRTTLTGTEAQISNQMELDA